MRWAACFASRSPRRLVSSLQISEGIARAAARHTRRIVKNEMRGESSFSKSVSSSLNLDISGFYASIWLFDKCQCQLWNWLFHRSNCTSVTFIFQADKMSETIFFGIWSLNGQNDMPTFWTFIFAAPALLSDSEGSRHAAAKSAHLSRPQSMLIMMIGNDNS